MFSRILRTIREQIRTREYILTLHAEEEKEADGLTILDVENCILVGEIVERQRDRQFSEWKYRISGHSIAGHDMELLRSSAPLESWLLSPYTYPNHPMKPSMKCDICGKAGVKIRRVSRSYGKGKQLLVIENVPIISCPSCGESYLTADTLHEIERLKRHHKTLGVERQIKTIAFAA